MTLPKFLIPYKVKFVQWKTNKQEKKFLYDHLVKEDGHMSRDALHRLCIAYEKHQHHSDFADPYPFGFMLRKSNIDLFSMVLSEHQIGSDLRIVIRTRMHKVMHHIPDPCIEVTVEKHKSHFTKNNRNRIDEKTYEFMNSISVTTLLNPSGVAQYTKEDVKELITRLRKIFHWVIEEVIDWRTYDEGNG